MKLHPTLIRVLGCLVMVVCLNWLVSHTQPIRAATYYVDGSSGNNSNTGTTTDQAWATVQYAAQQAVAGDVVIIRAGYYNEQITPTNSGSSGLPITYRAYTGETVAIGGQRIGLDLTNLSYLTFEDITIRDVGYSAAGNYADHWALMDNSHYITFDNMNFTFTTDPMEANFQGIYINNASSYITISNSTVEKWGRYQYTPPNTIGGDAIQINGNSHHILIENNTLGRADHASLQVARGHDVVIRNNQVYNDSEKAFEVAERTDGATYNVLLDGNTVWGSNFNVEDHGGLCMHLAAPENILRRNTFRDCRLWAVGCYVWGIIADGGDVTYSCQDNRIYNNVFAHNMIDPDGYSGTLSTWSATGFQMNDNGVGGGDVRDNVLKNNILYNNQPNNATPDPENPGRNYHQLGVDIDAQPDPPFAGNRFAGNIIYYDGADQQVIQVTNGGGLSTVSYFDTNFASFFWNNLQLDPLFVTFNPGVASDPTDGSYDFHLQDTSPAIDAGVNLTTTTSAGSGTSVTVADARYFHDGYDGLITADQIRIGDDTVYITNVNYATNVITIDTSISWGSGDAVNLVYYGVAPDIGAFESGAPDPSPSPSPSASPNSSSTSSSSSGGTSMPRPPGCAQAEPGSTPNLFRVDRFGSQATLYFTPVTSNIDRYFVAYGRSQQSQEYGVEFSSQSSTGVLSYTIYDLNPLLEYFFQIRAGNGCMPGYWSNTAEGTQSN